MEETEERRRVWMFGACSDASLSVINADNALTLESTTTTTTTTIMRTESPIKKLKKKKRK